MPLKMEKFLQIAPHSLAIVLGPAEGPAGERSGAAPPAPPAQPRQLARHHIGYEIFADFKAENMQHFWNKKVTAAVAETFFLGWIDEQVLLIQGKEEHLEALREGWTRRALRPPSGFHIRCLGECCCPGAPPRPRPRLPPPPRPAGGGAGGPLRAGLGNCLAPKPGFVPGPHASRPAAEPPGGGAVPGAGQVGGGGGGGAGGSAGRRVGGRSGTASRTFSALLAGGVCASRRDAEREDSGSIRWPRALRRGGGGRLRCAAAPGRPFRMRPAAPERLPSQRGHLCARRGCAFPCRCPVQHAFLRATSRAGGGKGPEQDSDVRSSAVEKTMYPGREPRGALAAPRVLAELFPTAPLDTFFSIPFASLLDTLLSFVPWTR